VQKARIRAVLEKKNLSVRVERILSEYVSAISPLTTIARNAKKVGK